MRSVASFFSFVFHPLFILTYMVLVLLWTNPFSFGWRHVAEADTLLIIIVMTSITLPAVAILMMKALGWINDFRLETRHERIGPYIASGIMYLTLYLHVARADSFPVSLHVVTLGSLIALWTCFFINNFFKISLHAAGVGGLVAMITLTKITFGYANAQIGLPGGVNVVLPLDYILYVVILIAGMVCTSRLILKAHNLKEVYMGFLIGVASIVIAYFIMR
jgi:hypothetical protein